MRDFRKLEIWKEAVDFSVEIYSITRNFPNEEKFGIVSQMNRACVSISSNVAEGSLRTDKELNSI